MRITCRKNPNKVLKEIELNVAIYLLGGARVENFSCKYFMNDVCGKNGSEKCKLLKFNGIKRSHLLSTTKELLT